MSPWLRLLAVLLAVVVAAFLLKVLPPIIVLVGFIAGVAYVNQRLKAGAKREARRDDVAVVGLKKVEQDPFGLLGYPFALFGRGDDPRIEDLSYGTWRGLEVRRFDVTFEHPVGGPEAERPRFTCVITPLGGRAIPLVVEPVTFVMRLATEAPMPQQATGHERVDRAFVVRCADAAFVPELIDGEMAGWLASLGEDQGFEVSGALAMLYGPASALVDVVLTLEVMQAFLDHIPASVRVGDPAPPGGSTSP